MLLGSLLSMPLTTLNEGAPQEFPWTWSHQEVRHQPGLERDDAARYVLDECSGAGEERALGADTGSEGEAPGERPKGWDVDKCPSKMW